MRAKQIRDLLVELTHLLLEELQFLERHLDQPPIDRFQDRRHSAAILTRLPHQYSDFFHS
jgi:hypothetical protein